MAVDPDGSAAGRPSRPPDPPDLPEHVALNRTHWDQIAAEYVASGERAWARAPGDETWGIFGVPEANVRMLPDNLHGTDAIELGCGTAYVSAWMARRGARVVGIDNSPAQLATATRLQREQRIDFPLILGNAERVPFPDASFDFAISEYGAALWADPHAWVPEAARLLRAGGRLHLLTNSLLAYLTVPDLEAEGAADERLKRPQFGMHRTVWPDEPGSVEFHLSHGDWIRLFRASGFEVEALVEPPVPPSSTTRYGWMTAEWASRWPCEEIWKVRRRE
jgi:SAM-dependent methyltransferase